MTLPVLYFSLHLVVMIPSPFSAVTLIVTVPEHPLVPGRIPPCASFCSNVAFDLDFAAAAPIDRPLWQCLQSPNVPKPPRHAGAIHASSCLVVHWQPAPWRARVSDGRVRHSHGSRVLSSIHRGAAVANMLGNGRFQSATPSSYCCLRRSSWWHDCVCVSVTCTGCGRRLLEACNQLQRGSIE